MEEAQKGWSQEGIKGMMEGEPVEKRGEVADSQTSEEGTIKTVNPLEDLEEWIK